MVVIEWTELARADFVSAIAVVAAERNQEAAMHLFDRVADEVGLLADNPFRGEIGRVTATRELSVTGHDYFVAFTVLPARVVVLRLLSALAPGTDRTVGPESTS
ncbi:type II toxin-antitoxin system RelE/ParE family toxin [Chthonobacter rhizosphaerae]|uniref:type II toxin-antitoxin system RelE/ParE family toxin n=1 Tax=Chthonobacter rhizosphaerae TaxID=2735553 RepID=UPI0015EE60ED|nr:type II toxin-antitoxin system RelE/ParE family toxin [Chthonobacter rhizosphaerae]